MIKTIREQLMRYLGEFIDNFFGDKYTGWSMFVSWDGQIVDMDKESILLLQRLQGAEHKDGFLHKIRTEEYV